MEDGERDTVRKQSRRPDMPLTPKVQNPASKAAQTMHWVPLTELTGSPRPALKAGKSTRRAALKGEQRFLVELFRAAAAAFGHDVTERTDAEILACLEASPVPKTLTKTRADFDEGFEAFLAKVLSPRLG